MDRAHELRQQMTLAETKLWQRLKARRLGVHFRRQQIIAGYIADFYCHSAHLVVEGDGEMHQQQKEYDLVRDQSFQGMGLRVVRFYNEEVLTDTEGVVRQIKALLE